MKYLPWLILWLLAALILLTSHPARAYQPTVAWDHPTQTEAGYPLTEDKILGTRVEYGTCNGTDFGLPLYAFEVVGTKHRITAPNVQPGVYCYRLQTRTAGGLSAWSVVVRLVVPSGTCGSGCH